MIALRTAQPGDEPGIAGLLDALTEADGVAPISEYKMLCPVGGAHRKVVVAVDGDDVIVGYGHMAWRRGADTPGHWAVEVAAAPTDQRSALVLRIVERLRGSVAPSTACLLWSWAGYVSAIAVENHWPKVRSMLEMRRTLPIEAGRAVPDGIRLTGFRRGVDEEQWLAVNNAAFAGHPENGNLSSTDLEAKLSQAWFDPAGFIVARRGEKIVGGCWTKLHPGGVGEIYVIAVHPDCSGEGLGAVLVEQGLSYLHETGHATRGMLYAESTNVPALNLYRKLGFRTARLISAFSLPSTQPKDWPQERQ